MSAKSNTSTQTGSAAAEKPKSKKGLRRARKRERATQALVGSPTNLLDGPTRPKKQNVRPTQPKPKGSSSDQAALTARAAALLEQRKALPIYDGKHDIVETIKAEPVVIFVGETGSGKTTQIPQFLHEAGITKEGAIGITQPRRVAATSLATRVSEEAGCRLGGLVGYTVRFDDTSSPRTLIKYLTDGMLLREILSDPLLTRYRVIILDEAHERTIRTDVLFGMLKRIQKTRQEQVDKFTVLDVSPPIYPLKIVVMSATMNAGQFSRYFNQAPILIVEGRQHEVLTLCTSEAQSDYLEAARRKVLEFHRVAPRGDILVFLSGQDEIESLQKILAENIKEFPEGEWPLHVLPLFAALPPAQQAKVFVPSPPNSRKVILATNIAETSITISGVRYVVDTGVAKFRSFNPKIGIETLQIEAISQSAADQRSGRAGREDKGVCVRLYTRETYAALPLDAKPEILRCNLAPVVLQLKAVGVDDILGFDFLDPPEHASLCRALEQLYALEALDGKGHLTAEGKRMAEFPLDPTWAKVLFAAESLHCTKEVIDLISLQTADNIFFSPPQQRTEAQEARKKFLDHHGDHFTHMNVLKEYQEASGDAHWCRRNFINQRAIINVLEVRKQLRMITRRVGVDPDVSVGSGGDKEVVLQCLLRGFFQNVALLQPDGRTYKGLVTNVAVFVHPMSALSMRKAEAIVFDEIVQTTRPYARGVSAIRAGWLVDAAPRYYGNARVPGR